MNKKVLIGMLLVFCVTISGFAAIWINASGQPLSECTVYVDPAEQTVTVCSNFIVNINIANVTNLYGLDIQVSWNTALMDYISHTTKIPVETYPDGVLHPPIIWVKDEVNETAGTYWLACASMDPAPSFSGSGTIVTITFHCTGFGEGIVNLDNVDLVDIYPNPIPTTVVNGKVIQLLHWEPIKLIDIVEWPYPYVLVDIPFVPPSSSEGYNEVKAELGLKGYTFDPAMGTAAEVTMFIEEEEYTATVTSWWSDNTLEDGTRACMLSYETEDPEDSGMAMGFVTNVLPPDQIPEVDPYIIYNAEPYFFIDFYWWAWTPIGKIVHYYYWWHDSHHHPNWFWGPYWWWRIYTRAYYYPYTVIPYWRPWWGWWWHWMYWRHWYWWSSYFPYDP